MWRCCDTLLQVSGNREVALIEWNLKESILQNSIKNEIFTTVSLLYLKYSILLQAIVFFLVWSTFLYFTVTLWPLMLYIVVVSSNKICSWYCEALLLAKNSLIPWQACMWIFRCCSICNYILLSDTFGIDCVKTWLSSSIPVTFSKGIKPILAERRSVLTGDCNVAGSEDAPWCSPWPNSWEREVLQTE